MDHEHPWKDGCISESWNPGVHLVDTPTHIDPNFGTSKSVSFRLKWTGDTKFLGDLGSPPVVALARSSEALAKQLGWTEIVEGNSCFLLSLYLQLNVSKCSMTPLTKCLALWPYVHVGTFESLQAGRHVLNIWNSWFVGSLVFSPSSRKLPGWCLEVSTWSNSVENRRNTNSATVTRSLAPTPPSKQTSWGDCWVSHPFPFSHFSRL